MTNDLAVQNGAAQVAEKQRVPVVAGPRGIALGSLEEMYRFAQYVAKSGLAPKGMEHPEAILIAIQMGAEIGLTPMASLQNIAVINGRPSVWGDAMLAVCRSQGVFDESVFDEVLDGEGESYGCTCTVRRLPNGKLKSHRFTVADAKKASLWGKSGPWTQYPKRMLQMRARSFCMRDAFADLLRGFKCAEEMYESIPVEHGEPGQLPKSLDELTAKLESPAKPSEPKPAQSIDPDPFRDESPKQPAKKTKTSQNRGLLEDDPEPSGMSSYPTNE